MFKFLITGVTALSLTLATAQPVRANGLNEDTFGKILFGLVAAATLNAAIDNRNDRRNDRQVQTQTHQPNYVAPAPQRQNTRIPRRNILPRECLRHVDTRFGEHRMFTRRCLRNTYAFTPTLPRRCAVRVFTNRGPVRGFDPQCLRQEGYRARR